MEERYDPITGELIQAGDTIVLCAGCGSAFFAETWDYLEGRHCRQSQTLEQLPGIRHLTVKWSTGSPRFSNEIGGELRKWWASVGLAALFLIMSLVTNFESIFMLIYFFILLIGAFGESQRSIYKLTIRDKALELRYPLSLFPEKRLQRIPLETLESITYRERDGILGSRRPLLLLKNKAGKIRRLTLPSTFTNTRVRRNLVDALRLLRGRVRVVIK